MPKESQTLIHPIDPIFREDSRILILGSFPSLLSRQNQFYYGNPQNRFWKVLAAVLHCKLPQTNEEKRDLLLSNKVALWDVIASCRISGSADSSIADVVPNDFSKILSCAQIGKILLNGKTAERLFYKYNPNVKIPAVPLPSTSPANAAWTLERLIFAWREGFGIF